MKVVCCAHEADALREEWLALLQRSEQSELMQSPDWLLTWWRVYGKTSSRRLQLGLFYDGEHLVGLAPLLSRRYWYGGVVPYRRLEFMGAGEARGHGIYSNHLAVIAERGFEKFVAKQLAKALGAEAFGGWDEVVLPMMAGETTMAQCLVEEFQAAGLCTEAATLTQARYISLPATWDDYFQSLSRNRRKKLQRALRAFEAWSGQAAQYEIFSTPAEVGEAQRILIQLHQKRWSNGGAFQSRLFLEFHDELMSRLAENGCLEVLVLRGRGEPVAAMYNMIWRDKVYSYQCGRRTDLPERLSPGAVLDAFAIRRSIELGRREFDLLADDYEYKKALTPQARSLLRLRVSRPSLREWLRCFGLAMARRWRAVPSQGSSHVVALPDTHSTENHCS